MVAEKSQKSRRIRRSQGTGTREFTWLAESVEEEGPRNWTKL